MSCEICGRGACMKSFHSLEEQENYDSVADDIKDRCINGIANAVDSIEGEWSECGTKYLLDHEQVMAVIRDYY